jgi:putative ABC transport system substrate-binding protein
MVRTGRRRWLAAAWAWFLAPRPAGAQRDTQVARIGFVSPTAPGGRDEAFVQGMRALGYVDGRNVELLMRFADGRAERLPALVAELVALRVDVLVAGSTIGARAAKHATTTIPVVFAGSSDPVAAGIVVNLARPEGNLTGTSTAYSEGFAGKWLELLQEAVPAARHLALLWSSANASAVRFVHDVEVAARRSKTRVDVHPAGDAGELDEALAAIGRSGAQGLIVTPSPFASSQQDRLVRYAAARRLPAVYFADSFVEAGGLMSYGPSIVDAYRRAAAYVDRILKGARPTDLPVEQPTQFELVINVKAAKALGLVVPATLLARADRVIS